MDYKKLLFASTVLTGMLSLGAANNEKTAHADTIDANSAVESNTKVAPQSNVITVKNTKATPAPVAEAPKAEAPVVENTTPATETKQEVAPVVEKTEAQPATEEKATQGQIQNQIDKETNHMNQDQNKVGQLENENQGLKDEIHKVDQEHQNKVDEIKQEAEKDSKPAKDQIHKIEQDQINAEKDKIQNDINHKKDELSQTQNNSAKTEQTIKDKKGELDKLNKNEQTSVIGSIVNNDKIGIHDKFPYFNGHKVNETEEDKQYDGIAEFNKDNIGKETIKNHKLTQEQAWNINVYLMNRINATRKAAGQKEIKVTREAFDKVYQRANDAKDNYNHEMSSINKVFGNDWAGENLGFAGDDEDLARTISRALSTILEMLNHDGGEDHWGHLENFMVDYSKRGFKEVQGAFAIVWSDKYHRWVLVFDTMKYHGETDRSHDLDKYLGHNGNQDKINKLKAEIAQKEKDLAASRQKEKDLQKAIADLEAKKQNVKFDYNKLNDDQKLDHIVANQSLELIKQVAEKKYEQESKNYEDKVNSLREKAANNDKEIQRLNKEIKQHKEKIADLKAQLKEEGNKPAPKPDTKPDNKPSKPETKPETKPDNKPNKPDTKPETKPDNKPNKPETKPDNKPNKPDTKPETKPENPGDGIIGNDGISKPVKPQNPNDNIDDEDPNDPIKNDSCDNDWDSPEDEIVSDGTQTGNDNNHPGASVVDGNVVGGTGNNSTGSTTGTASSTQGTTGHLVSSAKKYVVTPEVEAAEIIPTAKKATNSDTLPQTGSSKGETLAALGVMTVTMSSLLAVAAFRRRKEN